MRQFGCSFAHGALVVNWPTIIHCYVGLGVIYRDAVADQDLTGRCCLFFTRWDLQKYKVSASICTYLFI
ncbi:hypothetical protein [Microbulbifer spongiae]|uniref:Uncharacterized protein n=1 Tax=Microbulbifer spongiae TaxID=2944933 RepID=A0ABY9E675_9GAMM|nr:hypothetical protein [Microbulbifer sp. MI-G]WKD48525.1 hypothetical protein M8T91_11385 [Microbulbifer sp. MI-G]